MLTVFLGEETCFVLLFLDERCENYRIALYLWRRNENQLNLWMNEITFMINQKDCKDQLMSQLSNAIKVPMIILVIFVLAFLLCFVEEEYDKLML